MSWYKIRCLSAGENILAQKILFEKGYSWLTGQQVPMFTEEGQNLYIKSEEGEITRSALGSNHFEEDSLHSQINLSGIMQL